MNEAREINKLLDAYISTQESKIILYSLPEYELSKDIAAEINKEYNVKIQIV